MNSMKPTNIAHSKLKFIQPIFNNIFFSCDNHYVIAAKTPETEGKLIIEFKNEKGHENRGLFKDDREKDRARVLLDSNWQDDSESDDDFKCGPGMC